MSTIDRSACRSRVVDALLAIACVASLSGCWMFAQSPCESDENCPSGSTCSGGYCYDPTSIVTGGVTGYTCDGVTECPTEVCGGSECLSEEEAANAVEDDVYVLSEDDWAALASVTAVIGDIYLGTDSIIYDAEDTTLVVSGDVVLPLLRRVQGGVHFWGQRGVTSISMPSLRVLDGSFEAVDMPDLVSISLPELAVVPSLVYTGVAGELSFEGTPKLALLSAPKLPDIGWISIDPVGYVETPVFGDPLVLELNALTHVGNIDIWSEGNMPVLSFPALEEVRGRIYVRFPDGLETLSFPNLETVGDEFNIYRATDLTNLEVDSLTSVATIAFEDNDALTALEFPSLATVGTSLSITGHDALSTLTAPVLTSVNNGFTISGNPNLDACAAKAIADQSSPGGSIDLSGNLGDESACP